MNILVFFFAIFFLLIGIIFVYAPTWIVRFNKIAREKIFNDAIVLLSRRKKGVFFLLLSTIFFFYGYHRTQYTYRKYIDKLVSNDRLLYQTLQHIQAQEYGTAKALCEKALNRDPNNAEALYHLGAIQLLMNDETGGQQTWSKAASLAPDSPEARHLMALVRQLKKTTPEKLQ